MTPSTRKATTERVFGCSATSNRGFVMDQKNETLYYTAGNVVVALQPRTGRQWTLATKDRSPFVCLCVGTQGNIIAGAQATASGTIISLFDAIQHKLLRSFKVQVNGVAGMDIDAAEEYLVIASQGTEDQPRMIYVFSMINGLLTYRASTQENIHRVLFTRAVADGLVLMTAGSKSLKAWIPEGPLPSTELLMERSVKPVELRGRLCILGPGRAPLSDLCLSARAQGCLALSKRGHLSEINSDGMSERWADCRVSPSFACCTTDQWAVAAGAQGIVRLFNLQSLKYVASLPALPQLQYPHAFTEAPDPAAALVAPDDGTPPDAIAVAALADSSIVCVLYDTGILAVWNTLDPTTAQLERTGWLCPKGPLHAVVPWCGNGWATTHQSTVAFWLPERSLTAPQADFERLGVMSLRRTARSAMFTWPIDGEDAEGSTCLYDSHLAGLISLPPDSGEVAALAISGNGRAAVVGSSTGCVLLYAYSTPVQGFHLSTKIEPEEADLAVTDVVLLSEPNGAAFLAVAGFSDGTIKMIDATPTGQALMDERQLETQAIVAMALGKTDDGPILCLGYESGTVAFIRCHLERGRFGLRGTIPLPYATHDCEGSVTGLDMTADASTAFVATSTGRLMVFDPIEGCATKTYSPKTRGASGSRRPGSITLGPDGCFALICSADDQVRVFDIRSGSVPIRLRFPGCPSDATLVTSNDTVHAIVGNCEGTIVRYVFPTESELVRSITRKQPQAKPEKAQTEEEPMPMDAETIANALRFIKGRGKDDFGRKAARRHGMAELESIRDKLPKVEGPIPTVTQFIRNPVEASRPRTAADTDDSKPKLPTKETAQATEATIEPPKESLEPKRPTTGIAERIGTSELEDLFQRPLITSTIPLTESAVVSAEAMDSVLQASDTEVDSSFNTGLSPASPFKVPSPIQSAEPVSKPKVEEPEVQSTTDTDNETSIPSVIDSAAETPPPEHSLSDKETETSVVDNIVVDETKPDTESGIEVESLSPKPSHTKTEVLQTQKENEESPVEIIPIDSSKPSPEEPVLPSFRTSLQDDDDADDEADRLFESQALPPLVAKPVDMGATGLATEESQHIEPSGDSADPMEAQDELVTSETDFILPHIEESVSTFPADIQVLAHDSPTSKGQVDSITAQLKQLESFQSMFDTFISSFQVASHSLDGHDPLLGKYQSVFGHMRASLELPALSTSIPDETRFPLTQSSQLTDMIQTAVAPMFSQLQQQINTLTKRLSMAETVSEEEDIEL